MFTAVRYFSFVLIGALWLISRPALFGQQIEPALRHYAVDDGLPSSEVYHAMQDSRGFMWFGTDHGAVRFDGTRFRVYTTADGLPDNTVFGAYEAKDGKVWFYTYSGCFTTSRLPPLSLASPPPAV
ncbi:MAG: two-component regulator propeller domain-containing protein, partial [Bacteroidota bacterium]